MADDIPLADLADAVSESPDNIVPDPKPKRSRARAPRNTTRVPQIKNGQISEPIGNIYRMIGALMMPFDPQCGMVVLQSADNAADSLENLAKTNPAVRKALLALTQTSAWGTVLAAHTPILMAVASHHFNIGPNVLGNAPEGENVNDQS